MNDTRNEIAEYRLIEPAYFTNAVTVLKRREDDNSAPREWTDILLEAGAEIRWTDLPEHYMEPINEAAHEMCELHADRMSKRDHVAELPVLLSAIAEPPSVAPSPAPPPATPDAQVPTAASSGGGALAEACEFLSGLLMQSEAGISVGDIRAKAESQGHSWRSVQRAKEALGVDAKKRGKGGWVWILSPSRPAHQHHALRTAP